MRTLTLLVLASSLAAQSTWTVDASGGGDFTSLAAAVAAAEVLDGDTLQVEPGSYLPFVTAKALHIVGRAGGAPPSVQLESRLQGSAFATLAGLNFDELICEDIPGRLVLEDCDIGHPFSSTFGITDSFRIENCAEVVVSNGVLRGKTGDLWNGEAPGLRVLSSVVTLVNCTIFGGDGADGDTLGYPGQPGVEILDFSVVIVAGCSATGGYGGHGDFGWCQSAGAAGLYVRDSTLWVRGDESELIAGGQDCPFGAVAAIDGGWSNVTVSGVSLQVPAISPSIPFTGTLAQPEPDQPFLWIGGNPAPGGPRRLNVAGPSGAQALVLFSLQPLLLDSPKLLGGPLWLDPGAALVQLALVTIGQELPINVNLPLPLEPGFAGLTATAQGFLPVAGNKLMATNPATIVLRF